MWCRRACRQILAASCALVAHAGSGGWQWRGAWSRVGPLSPTKKSSASSTSSLREVGGDKITTATDEDARRVLEEQTSIQPQAGALVSTLAGGGSSTFPIIRSPSAGSSLTVASSSSSRCRLFRSPRDAGEEACEVALSVIREHEEEEAGRWKRLRGMWRGTPSPWLDADEVSMLEQKGLTSDVSGPDSSTFSASGSLQVSTRASGRTGYYNHGRLKGSSTSTSSSADYDRLRALQSGAGSSPPSTPGTSSTSDELALSYDVGNVTVFLNGTISGIVQPENLPLQARGRWVIDSQNNRINLRCVNWYGPHMEHGAVNGLNVQPLSLIARVIRDSDFNCVRLTYSLDLVYNRTRIDNPQEQLARNRDLWELSPLEIFDRTVQALTSEKIMVFLNNHVSSAGWCCGDDDGEGLWYTAVYSERDWLDALVFMSVRYGNNPYVVGHDIRNEIRPGMGKTPVWFSANRYEAWAPAALRAALELQSTAPHQLVVVSALYYGMFLCDVGEFPLHELLPGKIVYAAHAYAWYSIRFHVRTMIEIYLSSFVAFLVLSWIFVLYLSLQARYCPDNFFARGVTMSLRFCCRGRARRSASRKESSSGGRAGKCGHQGGAGRRKNRDNEGGVLERCCGRMQENKLLTMASVLTIAVPIMAFISTLYGEVCDLRSRAYAMIIFIMTSAVAGTSIILWFVVFVRGMIAYGPLLSLSYSADASSQLRSLLQSPVSDTATARGANGGTGGQGKTSEGMMGGIGPSAAQGDRGDSERSILRSPIDAYRREERRTRRRQRKARRRERRRLRREAAARGEFLLSPDVSSDDESTDSALEDDSTLVDVYPRPLVGAPVSVTSDVFPRGGATPVGYGGQPLHVGEILVRPAPGGNTRTVAGLYSYRTGGSTASGVAPVSQIRSHSFSHSHSTSSQRSFSTEQRAVRSGDHLPSSSRDHPPRKSSREQTALSSRERVPLPGGGYGNHYRLPPGAFAPNFGEGGVVLRQSSTRLRRAFSEEAGSRSYHTQQHDGSYNSSSSSTSLTRAAAGAPGGRFDAGRIRRSTPPGGAPAEVPTLVRQTTEHSISEGALLRDDEVEITSRGHEQMQNLPLGPFQSAIVQASAGLKRSFAEMGVAMVSETPTPDTRYLLDEEGGHRNIIPSSSSSGKAGMTADGDGRLPHLDSGSATGGSVTGSKTSSATASEKVTEAEFHSLSETEGPPEAAVPASQEPTEELQLLRGRLQAAVMQSPDVAAGVPAGSSSRHLQGGSREQEGHDLQRALIREGEHNAVEAEPNDEERGVREDNTIGADGAAGGPPPSGAVAVATSSSRLGSGRPLPGDELPFGDCHSSTESHSGVPSSQPLPAAPHETHGGSSSSSRAPNTGAVTQTPLVIPTSRSGRSESSTSYTNTWNPAAAPRQYQAHGINSGFAPPRAITSPDRADRPLHFDQVNVNNVLRAGDLSRMHSNANLNRSQPYDTLSSSASVISPDHSVSYLGDGASTSSRHAQHHQRAPVFNKVLGAAGNENHLMSTHLTLAAAAGQQRGRSTSGSTLRGHRGPGMKAPPPSAFRYSAERFTQQRTGSGSASPLFHQGKRDHSLSAGGLLSAVLPRVASSSADLAKGARGGSAEKVELPGGNALVLQQVLRSAGQAGGEVVDLLGEGAPGPTESRDAVDGIGNTLTDKKDGDSTRDHHESTCAPKLQTPTWVERLRNCLTFRWYHWFLLLLIVLVLTLVLIYSYLGAYDIFEEELDKNWGFVVKSGMAPVWLNEFGTGNPGSWWRNIVRYINDNQLDFAYWSIDGQQRPGKPESFGLLEDTYDEYKHFVTKVLTLSRNLTDSVKEKHGRYFPRVVVDYYDQRGILPPWDEYYDSIN